MRASAYTRNCEAYLDPLLLFLCQHLVIYHFRLYRDTCQALETKPYVPVELALRLHLLDEKSGLYPHAEVTGFVCSRTSGVFDRYLGDVLTEARLVGDDMARLKRHCTREPVWPLVDIQERAEAVTCSVLHCDG